MKLEKFKQFIIGLSIITPIFGFLMQATSFKPAVNIENAVLSSNSGEITTVITNHGDRVNNVKLNLFLEYKDKIIVLNVDKIESIPPIKGRITKDTFAKFEMPNQVYVGISYNGSYLIDNYWQLFLLDRKKLATVQFDITNYEGQEIKAGHNIFLNQNFEKTIKKL